MFNRCGLKSIVTMSPGRIQRSARALDLTGARTIRWIRPGDVVTMDYREDRLTIHLDGRGRVERLTCG